MDRALVAQAQVRAGRNIHAIAQIVQAIYLAEKCLQPNLTEQEKIDYQEVVDRNERKLRSFIATGILGKQ
jgi:hypothetical protein